MKDRENRTTRNEKNKIEKLKKDEEIRKKADTGLKKALTFAVAVVGVGSIAEASNKLANPQDIEVKNNVSNVNNSEIKMEENAIRNLEKPVKTEEITDKSYVETKKMESQEDYKLQVDMSSVLSETNVANEKIKTVDEDRKSEKKYIQTTNSNNSTNDHIVITEIPINRPNIRVATVKEKKKKNMKNKENIENSMDNVKGYFIELTQTTKGTVDKILKGDIIEVTENTFVEDKLKESALFQNIEEISVSLNDAKDSNEIKSSDNIKAEILIKLNKSLQSMTNKLSGKIINEDIRVISSGIDKLKIKISEKSNSQVAKSNYKNVADKDVILDLDGIVVSEVLYEDVLEKDKNVNLTKAESKPIELKISDLKSSNSNKADLNEVSSFDLGEEIERIATTNFLEINENKTNKLEEVSTKNYKDGKSNIKFNEIITNEKVSYKATPTLSTENSMILNPEYQISENAIVNLSEVNTVKPKISLLQNQKDFSNKELKEQLQAEIQKNRENEALIQELLKEIKELKGN